MITRLKLPQTIHDQVVSAFGSISLKCDNDELDDVVSEINAKTDFVNNNLGGTIKKPQVRAVQRRRRLRAFLNNLVDEIQTGIDADETVPQLKSRILSFVGTAGGGGRN